MSESKAVGSIEKSNLLSIIFAVKLGLWVIQNYEFWGWLSILLSLVFKYMFIGNKKASFFPHMGDGKVGKPFEKAILEVSYFL